jgi:outer membrane protein OmpU
MKKLGLSALAGSLVAFSANAAELSVNGGVELTYTDTGGNKGNEVTGNSYGANSSVTLSGSGDVGFGTVSMTRTLNDSNSGWGSSFQTLDLGGMGVLSFDSTAGALVGVTANDDLMPTAYEEVSTGVSTKGVTGVGSTNVIGYRNSFGMFSVSAGYSQNGTSTAESASSGEASHGSTEDIYVSAAIMDGLTIGAGHASNSSANVSATSEDTQESVMNIVYSTGPVSVGYRMAESNAGGAGTASRAIDHYSIAFNVNDNFAISWGQQDTDVEAISATAGVTEDVTGISAAYTAGAASIRVNHSKSDNDNGVVGTDDETTEVSLVLSF